MSKHNLNDEFLSDKYGDKQTESVSNKIMKTKINVA